MGIPLLPRLRVPDGMLAPEGEQRPGLLNRSQSPGLLSRMGVQPGMPRARNFLRDRAATLSGMGLAMLTARTQRQGYEGMMAAMDSGRQTDAYRNKQRTDEELRAKREQALATVMASLQEQGKLPAGMEGLAGLPEIAGPLLVDALKPRDPVETWEPTTMNGIPGQRSTVTGKFDEFTVPATPETWRPLSPQDRTSYNIPANDTRPWQISSNGDLRLPGQPGTVINNITEGERRNTGLAEVVMPELAIVEETWPALAQFGSQAADAVLPEAASNFIVSSDYQRARTAVKSIISSYLYSISGAQAPEAEVERQANQLMPQIGEGPEVIADKLAAIRGRVEAIKIVAGRGMTQGAPDGSAQPPQAGAQEPQRYRNPETGEVVEWNGAAWVRVPQ